MASYLGFERALSAAPGGLSLAWRGYRQEIRCEVLRYLRTPSFILPVLALPALFYLLFGLLLNQAPEARRLLLASYVSFGIMSPGLYGFGVALALERGNGLWQLKRIQPAPPGAYLLAKLMMAMLVGLLVGVILLALAAGLGGVVLKPSQLARVLTLSVLGVLPFAALGLWLGSLLRGQGGAGLINLVYLPLSALSGLWFPLALLPQWLQRQATLSPAWHLDQLAMAALDLGPAAWWRHALVLLGYTAIFAGLAWRRLQRQG